MSRNNAKCEAKQKNEEIVEQSQKNYMFISKCWQFQMQAEFLSLFLNVAFFKLCNHGKECKYRLSLKSLDWYDFFFF